MTTDRREASGTPTVLYIVGCGRSGSTLVERMLGAVPGFSNVGELARVFPSVATQDQRCGCGRLFSTCPFWQDVGAKAFGGWDADLLRRVTGLQRRLIRHRFVPALSVPGLGSKQFRAELGEYVEAFQALYAAVGQVSGARVVVDASKSPTQLLALRKSADLDLRVLNVVRDPRGVANSWSKVGVTKPHDHDGVQVMRSYAPRRTALIWSTIQAETALLRAASPHDALLRYEDLVVEPRTTLAKALTALGLGADTRDLSHIDGRAVNLEASHGISGNPSRFTAGRMDLRQDLGWQSELSKQDRFAVTALTLPLLIGHGYAPRSKVEAP
jgi:hypothetical protein